MKIRFTDLLLLAILVIAVMMMYLERRTPQPPIITAGPTQPAAWTVDPVLAAGTNANIAAMNTVAAATVQAMQQQAAGQVPATSTPGPTLNEYMGQPDGGNMFEGEVTIP